MTATPTRADSGQGSGFKFLRRAILAMALSVTAFVALNSTPAGAVCDGTIGSLPAADGGDGSQSFYLTGKRNLVMQSIVDASGTGYYVLVNLPNGQIWLEFYGDVTLVFDEQVLDDNPSIGMGLSAGFNGGGMFVMTEIDGQLEGRPRWVDMGFSMPTDYDTVADLAAGDFALITMQRQGLQRGRIDYDAVGGMFTVTQDL